MSWAWPFWKDPPESPLASSCRSTTRHFTASCTFSKPQEQRWISMEKNAQITEVQRDEHRPGKPNPSSVFQWDILAAGVWLPSMKLPVLLCHQTATYRMWMHVKCSKLVSLIPHFSVCSLHNAKTSIKTSSVLNYQQDVSKQSPNCAWKPAKEAICVYWMKGMSACVRNSCWDKISVAVNTVILQYPECHWWVS